MLEKYKAVKTIQAEKFENTSQQRIKYHIQTIDVNNFLIPTLEGNMRLHIGDYIATGVTGEHWSINAKIFHQTYQKLDE